MTGFTVSILATLGASLWAVNLADPTQVPTFELARPDATTTEVFSLLRGGRELPDGRLIATDWIEQRIAVIDFARGTVVNRGSVGSGPTEFRLPAALFAFRGDSTLLMDVGNTRLVVLDREGRIARSLTPPSPSAGSPAGVDARGNLYFGVPAWRASRPLPGDTIEIETQSVDGGAARVVTRIQGAVMAPPPSAPADGPRVPMLIFAPQDAFAVAPNGSIAIARGHDYSIEWLENGRTIGKEPAHSSERVPAQQQNGWRSCDSSCSHHP
ncbi:MAG: hypothetical protein ACRENP_13725 [Longimicrobiales bacterium]